MNNLECFTNLYSVSKTLRFELIPEPYTRSIFEGWLKDCTQENIKSTREKFKDNLFLQDKKIVEAYGVVKEELDKLHEEFINRSLESLKKIKDDDFSSYFEIYKRIKEENKKLSEAEVNALNEMEQKLRRIIGKSFKVGGEYFSKEIANITSSKKNKNTTKNNSSKKELPPWKYLMSKDIIEYLKSRTNDENNNVHFENFKNFFSYLEGYNINRENYYCFEEEKATSIATRIVHENLPIFCDNIIRFTRKKDEYLHMSKFLLECEKNLEIKDAKTGKFVRINPLSGEIFEICKFNQYLTQEDIENYNQVIGSYNLMINLYNQSQRQEDKNFKKLEEFSILKKQIGSKRVTNYYTPLIKDFDDLKENEENKDIILSVEKLINVVSNAGTKVFIESTESGIICTIPAFINFLKNCDDWRGIYWSKNAVTKIARYYIKNWYDILDVLKDNKTCAKKNKDIIQLQDAIELSNLFDVLDKFQVEMVFKENEIIDKSSSVSKNLINLLCSEMEDNIHTFFDCIDEIKNFKNFHNEKSIDQIKKCFDGMINVISIVRYFSVRRNKMKGNIANPKMDIALSNLLYNEEYQWFDWYDLIRNYLTKKPQDAVKNNQLKLNFGCSQLLKGWSDGYEKQKRSTLLRKDNEMYLCILKETSIFDSSKENNPVYLEASNADRMILQNLSFKTLVGKGFVRDYGEKYGDMSKKNPQEAIRKVYEIIEKKYAIKYPLLGDFCTNTNYTDKKNFEEAVKKVLEESYSIQYRPIDWKLIKEKEESGELFLFKISSKDFKEKSSGKKDLQTIYWEDVFSENSVHQLAAYGKIYLRDPLPLPEKKIGMHTEDKYLVNKKDKNGDVIPGKIYEDFYRLVNIKNDIEKSKYLRKMKELYQGEGYLSKHESEYLMNILKLHSLDLECLTLENIDKLVYIKNTTHTIQKDKRFYERKYFFHCPIKLNYQASKAIHNFNDTINENFQSKENLNFIGIDRGEKHLVYSCILDEDANILSCEHFDVINGTNYVHKLEDKSNERLHAKRNWQVQDSIKNLKEGYLSHVVHCLVDRVIKDEKGVINPHSYIVLEDLESIKPSRQKIEKQVYQNLETALAKKMNFIVDKGVDNGEIGSVCKALQLTPLVKTYQDIRNKQQFGVMFYTRANYTSITDPATGWRKTIYLKRGTDDEIKKQILDKFSDFGYDGKDYFFEYSEKNIGKTWRLYSGKDGVPLKRFKFVKDKNKGYWVPHEENIVQILTPIFKDFNLDISFMQQIKEGKKLKKIPGEKKTAWQSLCEAIDLIQQIRNSGEKNTINDNFLCSPVRDNNGCHFDTRNFVDNGPLKFIVDADANGAYNIARKGIIMNAHIKYFQSHSKKGNVLNLYVSDQEWDLYLLDRKQWEEKLNIFSFANKK